MQLKNILLLLILISSSLSAQNTLFYKNNHIYELDNKISNGDFRALIDVGFPKRRKPTKPTSQLRRHVRNSRYEINQKFGSFLLSLFQIEMQMYKPPVSICQILVIGFKQKKT